MVTESQLFYTDEKVTHLIVGNMFELRTMRNLTEERSKKLFALDFKSLPFDLALKKVKGNGSRKLAYFTDPNCGYCKKLEKDLLNVKDVTVYTFVIPILGGDSPDKSRDLWCAKDNTAAWRAWMVDGVRLPLLGQGGDREPPRVAWQRLMRAALGQTDDPELARMLAGRSVFVGSSAFFADEVMTPQGRLSGTALNAAVFEALGSDPLPVVRDRGAAVCLLTGLLHSLRHNLRHKNENASLFEVGHDVADGGRRERHRDDARDVARTHMMTGNQPPQFASHPDGE